MLANVEVEGARYMVVRCPAARGAGQPALSPRERAIALLMARGLPNKAVATALGISRWTVATYVRRLYAKLGVGTRAEMVARLAEEGLLGGGQTVRQ